MIQRLKSLFQKEQRHDAGGGHDDLHLAAAALLLESAALDGDFDASERETIATLLQSRFNLDAEETHSLIEAAEQKTEESVQLYGFTRVIKDRLDSRRRLQVIEMLWEVAYADGHLHYYEASLVRRVAGLLHVSDRESGLARRRVRERLDIDSAPTK